MREENSSIKTAQEMKHLEVKAAAQEEDLRFQQRDGPPAQRHHPPYTNHQPHHHQRPPVAARRPRLSLLRPSTAIGRRGDGSNGGGEEGEGLGLYSDDEGGALELELFGLAFGPSNCFFFCEKTRELGLNFGPNKMGITCFAYISLKKYLFILLFYY